MIEQLKEWAKKVSENKIKLDKQMFDDLIKTTIFKFDKLGLEKTMEWLDDNYEKGINHSMVGPHLLATNSIQIRNKMWSLNKKC